MPPKTKEWHRNYAVHYKADPARIAAIEQLIAILQNELNVSRSEALIAIFDAGVEAKTVDPQFANPTLRQSIAEARLMYALSVEVERQNERARAFKALGPLGILAVAEEVGVDPDNAIAVLESCRLAVGMESETSPSHAYKVWIGHFLSDGEAHPIDKITEQAIADQVLPNPGEGGYDKAVSLFRNVASSMGVSGGKRGWWKMPEIKTESGKDPF